MKAYIGDLCYILEDREWDTLCDLVNASSEEDTEMGGVFTINGKRLALYNTLYGDGQYTDSQGRVYLVDSGTIGIVLVDDDQAEVAGGHLHNVTESAISRFSVDDDGTFFVGTLDGEVLIRTGYEEEEDYEEDYDDYEEESEADDDEGEEG